MRVLVLRSRAKPIGESRRSCWVPCSLDDVCNSLVLERGRGSLLLLSRKKLRLLATMLLIVVVYTSVGGDRAVRLTLFDRLIEQDEVLLVGGQIQMLELQLLRGWGRQARRTGGKPC